LQSAAGSRFAAAITTTSSIKTASAFSRAWSRPSRTKAMPEGRSEAALRVSTTCSAADFRAAPARSAGKTLLCLEYIAAAVKRGERAALFEFDEELGLLFARAHGMGIDLAALRDEGKLHVEQMDAAEVSPGEFTHRVRTAVEKEAIRTVIVDSLNGYSAAMPEEQFLTLHLHEVIQYLNRRGTSTFVTLAQSGTIGEMRSPVDLTYLADNVLMLRYFEAFGRVRRAISVVKKRGGAHEDTIREFAITSDGLEVGLPLNQFQGVLRGVPTFFGGGEELMGADAAPDARRE
jgi:circadian clock protein KaiC